MSARSRIRAAAALVLAVLLSGLAAGQAAHATGYRYWSFWEREDGHGGNGASWVYATQGPATARPSDGAVEGFRFAVSADSADASRPRGTAGFTAVCAHTPARDGTKRVALVIDFGTASDAPAGEAPPAARTACARVSPDATAADALAAVAKPLRYDTDALLCAISGYPRRGCGEQVSGSDGSGRAAATAGTATAEETPASSGPSLGLIAGGTAVAVLGAAAVWRTRRRHRLHD
ncbi:SCO2322 family protein [Streptomyces sp. NPDC047000]|uniref:SCO2322 family protein n=1 Tax=Streptomyces sp. NPDC047000 TaxID=3155474 RepID=UPI0033C50D1D